MHQILVDYFRRFQPEPSKQFNYFFTQLSLEEYREKLPHVHDIEIFCERMTEALLKNEKVCIFSDYDTDAVTATAAMYWGLVELGFKQENLTFYAPDRFTEGYGMNPEAVAKLADENDLIVSVDCGINSTEEAEIIKKHPSCDLIITDHHHLHGPLPEALAVVNPRILTPKRGSTLLAESTTGVGVAWFCVVWLSYYLQGMKQAQPDLPVEVGPTARLNSLLGFVAIGTIADCQSVLEPTNRLLVRTGLKVLSSGNYSFPGLKELMIQTGLQDKLNQGYLLNSQDLGFILSPILNASGRISHAALSIRTLLANNSDEAALMARELIATNEERKNIVRNLTDNLNQIVLEQVESGQTTIWLEGDWNKGIIGLLASRFVNTYNLPTIVISTQEDLAVASLRAPEGYHLAEGLKEVSGLLEKFGGHPGAAGFSAKVENLREVKETLLQVLAQQSQDILKPNQNFATHLDSLPEKLSELTHLPHLIWIQPEHLEPALLEKTWLLDPFGQDLPMPRFIFEIKNYSVRWLGQENKHIKLTFESSQTVTIFNLLPENRNYFIQPNPDTRLWVEAKITQNTWNGSTKNELVAENLWIV